MSNLEALPSLSHKLICVLSSEGRGVFKSKADSPALRAHDGQVHDETGAENSMPQYKHLSTITQLHLIESIIISVIFQIIGQDYVHFKSSPYKNPDLFRPRLNKTENQSQNLSTCKLDYSEAHVQHIKAPKDILDT